MVRKLDQLEIKLYSVVPIICMRNIFRKSYMAQLAWLSG